MATMKIARRSTAYAATRDSAMAAFAAMESAVQGQFELAHIAVATRIGAASGLFRMIGELQPT
jgi:hypothetical protein